MSDMDFPAYATREEADKALTVAYCGEHPPSEYAHDIGAWANSEDLWHCLDCKKGFAKLDSLNDDLSCEDCSILGNH